jgi:hypothetical protein
MLPDDNKKVFFTSTSELFVAFLEAGFGMIRRNKLHTQRCLFVFCLFVCFVSVCFFILFYYFFYETPYFVVTSRE